MSVRGAIRAYIERQASLLGDSVLEIGSRIDCGQPWLINRDLARGSWLGIDVQPGEGVDFVADAQNLPAEWTEQFSGVLCSEVLEHVARPWLAIPEIFRVLQPGGYVVITTLFSFPEHSYPDDFYRYSASGIRLLLADAGFAEIETEYSGGFDVMLDDHGEGPINPRFIPMHIFAVARKPC